MARKRDLLMLENWIKDRIEKYDFTEDLDYFTAFAKFGEGFDGLNKRKAIDPKTGKILAREYVLSVDMAKELAMVENSEIGKKVRKYFIRVESDFKKVMRIATLDPKIIKALRDPLFRKMEQFMFLHKIQLSHWIKTEKKNGNLKPMVIPDLVQQ